MQMKPVIFTTSALALVLSACSVEDTAKQAEPEASADAAASATRVVDASAADADEVIASDASLVVLDVRTPSEYSDGHIDKAVNVDFRADDFATNLAKLDKSKRYLLHCKSGTRSARALQVMQEQGFENVVHMTDGFDAWKAAGNMVAQ
jgi:rhodanese-related sulfurtransferase